MRRWTGPVTMLVLFSFLAVGPITHTPRAQADCGSAGCAAPVACNPHAGSCWKPATSARCSQIVDPRARWNVPRNGWASQSGLLPGESAGARRKHHALHRLDRGEQNLDHHSDVVNGEADCVPVHHAAPPISGGCCFASSLISSSHGAAVL
jgi:hypothetical protein